MRNCLRCKYGKLVKKWTETGRPVLCLECDCNILPDILYGCECFELKENWED